MSHHLLIPRLGAEAAVQRLADIGSELRRGTSALHLVAETNEGAVPNETGGTPAANDDLRRWRRDVMGALDGTPTGSATDNAIHSMRLGQAITEFVHPSPSDVAHDGTWSYLSLMLFPDILAARWGAPDETQDLAADRWIGRQVGRDRNYLKLAWRRWQVLGPVMSATGDPLGEDEFGALLERSVVARNQRLVRCAALEIVSYRGDLARTAFARRLMRELTAFTGALQLDVLSDAELTRLVTEAGTRVGQRSTPAGI